METTLQNQTLLSLSDLVVKGKATIGCPKTVKPTLLFIVRLGTVTTAYKYVIITRVWL